MTQPDTQPNPGDKMPDGTIYAGISPDTGKAIYTTPEDASLNGATFKKAEKYASKLDAHGYQDWRLPTKGELNVLFNNRAAIGGFKLERSDLDKINGSGFDRWYWSNETDTRHKDWKVFDQDFVSGFQASHSTDCYAAVRCVRGMVVRRCIP